MPAWLNWLFDELTRIQQFPRTAIGLVVIAALGGWYIASFLYRNQISNLESEVALLKSQLATAESRVDVLPSYSLGGSEVLIYNSATWTTQDTARTVELDWSRLGDVDANAVLRLRTEGDSASAWVQGRVINMTNQEIVATTDRHTGSKIPVRLRIPRATGTKIYSMQIRGEGAGLEGNIELYTTT